MDASLDTDIVIHLYKSDKKDLLFLFFDKLYIHEYLLENEIKKKSTSVYEKVKVDIEKGHINVITNLDLVEMRVKRLFDTGEQYGVALAKTMGLASFLSDDTKNFGPHETLVKELIKDVIPFTFYELLFLKYINTDMSSANLYKEFEEVNSKSIVEHPMNFRIRMLTTVRRFSIRYGTERDKKWINEFCKNRNINYNKKMLDLKKLLKNL